MDPTMAGNEKSSRKFGKACQEFWKNWQIQVIVLVPLVFCPIPIVFSNPIGYTGYSIIIMATYWMTECIPMAATALLPILLFPVFGVQTSKEVCGNYITDMNMVFIGSIMVAAAVGHWNLHKRFALRILLMVGMKPRWLMLGFMVTTAFLSMWMCNTATTSMMVPVALAVLRELKRMDDNEKDGDLGHNNCLVECETEEVTSFKDREITNCAGVVTSFKLDDVKEDTEAHECDPGTLPVVINDTRPLDEDSESRDANGYRLMCKAITLSIPYAANIGGTATLTGTGPNLVLSTQLEKLYGPNTGVNFATWMAYAFPGMVLCLFLSWVWLQIMYLDCFCMERSDKTLSKEQEERARKVISRKYEALGPMSFAEWAILVHFIVLILLWLTRDPGFVSGWSVIFPEGYVTDATSVMLITLLLFIFPSRRPSFMCRKKSDYPDEKPRKIPRLLNWRVIHENMAWNVVLLLGGGAALADACKASGLSEWLGDQFVVFKDMSPPALAFIISIIVAAFTEVTSNPATATIFLPIFAELSTSLGLNPLYLMLPATLACSFAFMLPVATPPNAIAFANSDLTIMDMAKAGLMMNIICVLVSNLSLATLGVWVFDVHTFPDWANSTAATP